MNEYPRIFALVCASTNTVEYTSEVYSKVSGMRNCLPDSIRDLFEVVRYDPNVNYMPKQNQKENNQ